MKWTGRPGWAVSDANVELYQRIRGGLEARNQAEKAVVDKSQPMTFAELENAAQNAVVAGGRAYASTMFRPDDQYTTEREEPITYQEFIRRHHMQG